MSLPKATGCACAAIALPMWAGACGILWAAAKERPILASRLMDGLLVQYSVCDKLDPPVCGDPLQHLRMALDTKQEVWLDLVKIPLPLAFQQPDTPLQIVIKEMLSDPNVHDAEYYPYLTLYALTLVHEEPASGQNSGQP